MSVHMCSLESECPLLACLHSFHILTCLFIMLFREWVPLAHSNSFYILTCLSICAPSVCEYPSLTQILLVFNLSIHLHSSVCGCPPFTWISFVSSLACLFVLFSLWVPLACLESFYVLNWLICPSMLSRVWVCLTCSDPHSVLNCLVVPFRMWVLLVCLHSFYITHSFICTL